VEKLALNNIYSTSHVVVCVSSDNGKRSQICAECELMVSLG